MPCALRCDFISTYSTLIIDVIAFVKNDDVSIAAMPWDVATKESSCEQSQPSGQSNENLVVSTVGAMVTKKKYYSTCVRWYLVNRMIAIIVNMTLHVGIK